MEKMVRLKWVQYWMRLWEGKCLEGRFKMVAGAVNGAKVDRLKKSEHCG